MDDEIKNGRTEFDLGEIFRAFGPEYERTHNMTREQRKALLDLASCRTAVLGGHLWECPECHHQEPQYNSCYNKHCPKCQNAKRGEWVGKQMEQRLPVPYFHAVFTVPHMYNSLIYTDFKAYHNALFKAASKTVMDFFKKKGGVPAIIAVLHTFGQTLCRHSHIHMLISGGCLSFDKTKWIKVGDKFLFDVTKVNAIFRKNFLKELAKRVANFTPIAETQNQKKKWVIFCKHPFSTTETVIKYLGRYTYRTAISNSRILNFSDGKVTFDYKDYRELDKNKLPKHKTMTLGAIEFMERFLQHITPSRFRTVRHYGIVAGSNKDEKIAIAKELLKDEVCEEEEPESDLESEEITEVEEPHLCPSCGKAIMKEIDALNAVGPPPITFRKERGEDKHAA